MNVLSSLRDIGLFVEVARSLSFSVASVRLGMPRATVSRRIAAMEREFGLQLLKRTTRHVELTSVGQRYFERCAHLVDEARMTQESLRNDSAAHNGHIHLTMPVDLGVTIIGPLLASFSQRYPGITLKMDLSPQNTDLMREGIDLAIRLGAPKDERLIARQIGQISMGLFASKAYLDQHGRPQTPSDLTTHQCLLSHGNVGQVSVTLEDSESSQNVTVNARYVANNVGLLRVLAEHNMGIAALPDQFWDAIATTQSLERVLPHWHALAMPIYAVTSSRLRSSSVQAFLEFLGETMVGKA